MRISSFATAHRERERERRARAHLTRDPDPPPVQFHELAAEGQAEPRSLDLLVCSAHLPELLEHGLLVFWRDTDPGILDGHLHGTISRYSPNLDPSPFGCELDRVRQQVQHHLPDLPLVPPHLTEPLIDPHVQCDPSSPRPLADA